jgi:hypothetical protein
VFPPLGNARNAPPLGSNLCPTGACG